MTQEEFQKLEDIMLKSHLSKVSEISNLIGEIKEDIKELKSNYSKRELDHFIGDLTTKVDKILEQTTKTNGRVNAIEKELDMGNNEPTKLSRLSDTVAMLKEWRTYLLGAWGLLLLLGGYIIYVTDHEIERKIDKWVEKALSKYDIEYNLYEER